MRELLGFQLATDERVYRPDQDSTMLATALDPRAGEACLDLCTGTGLSALSMAKKAGGCVATDLDPHACRLARRNAEANGLDVQVLQTDLARGIHGRFDAISCNPPYLPTGPPEADVSTGRDVDGGRDGAEVSRRVLDALGDLLAPGGRCWMVASSLQPLDELEERAAERGLVWTVVDEASLSRFERLLVVRLERGEPGEHR